MTSAQIQKLSNIALEKAERHLGEKVQKEACTASTEIWESQAKAVEYQSAAEGTRQQLEELKINTAISKKMLLEGTAVTGILPQRAHFWSPQAVESQEIGDHGEPGKIICDMACTWQNLKSQQNVELSSVLVPTSSMSKTSEKPMNKIPKELKGAEKRYEKIALQTLQEYYLEKEKGLLGKKEKDEHNAILWQTREEELKEKYDQKIEKQSAEPMNKNTEVEDPKNTFEIKERTTEKPAELVKKYTKKSDVLKMKKDIKVLHHRAEKALKKPISRSLKQMKKTRKRLHQNKIAKIIQGSKKMTIKQEQQD